MLTNEEKIAERIETHKEAVEELKVDLGNVKTEHGRLSLMSTINEHLAELNRLEKGE